MSPHRADLILAIDVGTTSVKAALVDEDAQVIATGVAEQHIRSDPSGRRDHDPELTWRAVGRAVERSWIALAAAPWSPASDREGRGTVRAVVVTGPRGSFGIARSDGRPVGAMLTWQDRRAAGLVADLEQRTGSRQRQVTGFDMTPSAVLPKLIWLRQTQPKLFDDGWRIVTPQADVLRRLGVEDLVVDLSVAGHFGLLDIASLGWSDALLGVWDVPRGALPRLVSQGDVVGRVSATAAVRLSVPAGIPVVAAGSDGVCSELGAGVVDVGQIYAYLGTAGAVAGPLAAPRTGIDSALVVMPGSLPARYRVLGLMGSGGSARDLIMATLGVRDHVRFDRMAAAAPAGAGGVLCLATLAGASAPEPDGRARGMLVGLSLATSSNDIARAVLEGVALEMRAIIEAMENAIPTPTVVSLTGGGSRSTLWASILANVLQIPVLRVHEPNPGLRGAAQYGLAVLGRYPSVIDAATALPPGSDLVRPDIAQRDLYRDAAALYAQVRHSSRRDGIDAHIYERAPRPVA